MNVSTYSADQLLRVPLDRPERLFVPDLAQTRAIWRRLSGLWHPDRNAEAKAGFVFAHIRRLYEAALERIERGIWDDGERLEVRDRDGRRFRLKYRMNDKHDLGSVFIGDRTIGYLFEGDAKEWARDGRRAIKALSWANDGMRQALSLQLPACLRLVEGERFCLLVLGKSADFVPLARLRDALGGAVPTRHVAWIVSSLLNIGCYLEWAGLCHLAISEENCLVAPEGHSVALSGGWWFSQRAGSELTTLPARTVALAPPDALARRTAEARIDAALIRQLGLDLLADRSASAPQAMLDYLSLPGSGSAVQDYEEWQKTLWASFGVRRYSDLALSADAIIAMTSATNRNMRD